jgi:3-hydroxybutyryl-CoA dehydrogenase
MSHEIAVMGAGRMGRGIALSYIFAGIPVVLIDMKIRSSNERQALTDSALNEIQRDLNFLSDMGLVENECIPDIMSLVSFSHRDATENPLKNARFIFEGVPEVLDAKREAFTYANEAAPDNAVIASTTSTFLVTDLSQLVKKPSRFMNAHWLNPAHLMPLIEISRSKETSQSSLNEMIKSLESVGKMPIVCSASAGYIVPRIQALAMNEAARLVEEGVASAEDVDKAINVGFGIRFAVLGLLEFIDWGGGDILYYASKYLAREVGERYEAPDIVRENMESGRNGLRDGQGFFDYSDVDVNSYRQQRMQDFVAQLRFKNLLPTYKPAAKDE